MLRRTLLGVVSMTLLSGGTSQAEVVIEWVAIGDAGNTPWDLTMDDGTCCYGGVGYVYNIGKYEVTNKQYCEFLNAIAAVTDPNGVYNTSMNGGYGGITRSGSSGSYMYFTITGRRNMPVNYVNWYDAVRFANWLHNGQPTGVQDATTTEDGAYDMSLGAAVARKPGARVFLPSEDEWFKAAYHEGRLGHYWYYPTFSHNAPTAEAPPGSYSGNGSANYDGVLGDVTFVGSYTANPSASVYGTFDQGGNVSEWNEADLYGDGSYRGVRGGGFDDGHGTMGASWRTSTYAADGHHNLGFRVAGLPKPDSDRDGDVDLHDFALFQAAFTGPQ